MNKKPSPLSCGIDIAAPGGIEKLFAFHRSIFGDAVMEDPASKEKPEEKTEEKKDGDQKTDADADESKLGDAGLRALQRVRDEKEAEKQRADELQKKLDKIEEDKLSDIDKAKKQAADREKENEELRLQNLRLVAIADHSIPKDYHDLVLGTDAASFEASAKKVADLVKKALGKTGPDVVRESGGEGGSSGGNNSGGSVSSVAAGRDRFKARKNKK